MRKKLLWAAAVLLALVLCISAKLFLIGEPLEAAQVHCTVTEANGQLKLHVSTSASAIAFRGWKFRQEGNCLYIRARKVLVSPLFHSGVYETTITPDTLTEIYLGGDLIWAAE